MSRKIRVGAIQASYSQDMQANIDKVKGLVREAAGKGAEIILPSELFCDHYFCKVQDEKFFATAYPWADHPAVEQLSDLARELGVVIPVSIYEKDGPEYYNSIVIIDADGTPLGVYRKSHIPDGPGYMEKFYFRPGNTGFRVFETMKGTIGVGICWDQWFPETARAMALLGADVLFYPTAIGSEPHDASLDTAARWRRAMPSRTSSRSSQPIAQATRKARSSMARALSPTMPARSSMSLAAMKKESSRPNSISTSLIVTVRPGASSGTGGPTFTTCWARRGPVRRGAAASAGNAGAGRRGSPQAA